MLGNLTQLRETIKMIRVSIKGNFGDFQTKGLASVFVQDLGLD